MKRVHALFAALMVSGIALAQQPEQQVRFTLEQCIDYALANNINAQNARIEQQVADARVKETIGMGLPQVALGSSVMHNQQLPRFFTRYSTDGSSFIPFPTIPGANNGDVVALASPFQLASAGDANAQINQLIFNGSYIVGLQATTAFRQLAEKSALQTSEQITQAVMKAYYGVLINQERTTLFDANIARVDSLLRNTRALHENGFAENIDVDRIRVTYNNLVAERDKFLKVNELGYQILKFQMNYPMDQQITIVGSIQDVKVDTVLSNYKVGWDYKVRPDYQVLESQYRMQELNVKNNYAGAFPVIGAFANFGYSTQSPNVSGVFKTNTNISDQAGLGPDKWYSYSRFGINLSWNIFTGLSRTYKIQQEKLNLKKIENGFIALKSGIDLETEQAAIMFQNALRTLQIQRDNMELAGNVARITRIKYEQGVGSNLEVVDAESSLKEAQNNYYSAMFDAMIAKVDLDKAYGRLVPTTQNN
jgi:outer membrane protein TolC